jgi:hypothetical protein
MRRYVILDGLPGDATNAVTQPHFGELLFSKKLVNETDRNSAEEFCRFTF